MNVKENHYDKENIPTSRENSYKHFYCDPDKYLRQPEQYRKNIIECLVSARCQERPAFNKEFIRLVKLWRLIASKNTSGQIPSSDLDFLRWLLQGRAREGIVFLRHQSDISVWYALKAIERIANFNIPESNAMAHQMAMANWIWLKRELTGDVRYRSHVDIHKIRSRSQIAGKTNH